MKIGRKTKRAEVVVWASWGAAVLRPYMTVAARIGIARAGKKRRQDAGATRISERMVSRRRI